MRLSIRDCLHHEHLLATTHRAGVWGWKGGKLRRSTGGPPLLETFATENRPALCGIEGHCGFLAALGTHGGGLNPLMALTALSLVAFGFASLTALGLILKTLFGVKDLFACGEDEILAAFDTLQHPILVFHARPPVEVDPG